MMERVDQERPGWDGDQFDVLTGEEVAGVGGDVAEGVGPGGVGPGKVGLLGDGAGAGAGNDDQAEREDQGDDAGAGENDDGAGPGAGEERVRCGVMKTVLRAKRIGRETSRKRARGKGTKTRGCCAVTAAGEGLQREDTGGEDGGR